MELNKEKFRHTIKEVVKFHEVDLMGVCNNAVYFNYFEDARLKYIQDLAKKYNLDLVNDNSFFIMAHNESDYFEPAQLDDELLIYTRIGFVKNSSFGLEHLVEKTSTKEVIASGKGVLVYIDLSTRKPKNLPQEFYSAVKAFQEEVDILKNKD